MLHQLYPHKVDEAREADQLAVVAEDWRVSGVGKQHGLVHLHQEVLYLVGVVCVQGAVTMERKGGSDGQEGENVCEGQAGDEEKTEGRKGGERIVRGKGGRRRVRGAGRRLKKVRGYEETGQKEDSSSRRK